MLLVDHYDVVTALSTVAAPTASIIWIIEPIYYLVHFCANQKLRYFSNVHCYSN